MPCIRGRSAMRRKTASTAAPKILPKPGRCASYQSPASSNSARAAWRSTIARVIATTAPTLRPALVPRVPRRPDSLHHRQAGVQVLPVARPSVEVERAPRRCCPKSAVQEKVGRKPTCGQCPMIQSLSPFAILPTDCPSSYQNNAPNGTFHWGKHRDMATTASQRCDPLRHPPRQTVPTARHAPRLTVPTRQFPPSARIISLVTITHHRGDP